MESRDILLIFIGFYLQFYYQVKALSVVPGIRSYHYILHPSLVFILLVCYTLYISPKCVRNLHLNATDFFFELQKKAPSSPPAIDAQETRAEDAHTIRVKWNEINEQDQNGIIWGYTVYYNEKGQLKEFIKHTTVRNILITGLKPFTEYCIKVTGFTKIGISPQGNCFNVKTLDSGKQLQKKTFLSFLLTLFKISRGTKFSYETELNFFS